MTKIDSEPRQRRILAPVVGAIVAAAAAAAVVYGTLQPAGKAGGDCPADSARLAATLKPLARGDLAALQVTSDPRRPPSFAFERPDGAKATLADFHGRAVLLNLWATWCAPCRAEMPALDRLQAAKGGPQFEVVAVNVDTARLEKRGVFLDSIGVKTLTRYADPSGDVFETMRKDGKALGLPVTLVIDKEGCELASVEGGAKWDSANAQALVAALKGG
jgi:thiol-disulfide isomerase/thioredoxin